MESARTPAGALVAARLRGPLFPVSYRSLDRKLLQRAPARRLAAFVLGRELGHRLAGGNRVFPHMVVEIGRQFAM